MRKGVLALILCGLSILVLSSCDLDDNKEISVAELMIGYLAKKLGEANCQSNPTYEKGADGKPKLIETTLVSETRQVMLFVKHHIFVGGKLGSDGKWDPNSYTTAKAGKNYAEKNKDLVSNRKGQINTLMPMVNEILKQNGANIVLVSVQAVEVVYDPKFFPTTCPGGGCEGHVGEVAYAIAEKDPQYLHVLWGWKNLYAPQAVGLQRRVIICGELNEPGSVVLAHEFGHVFGEPHHEDPNNLMHETAKGTALTKKQLADIWEYIKKNGQELLSMTCDAPAP